ncbi:uncharacterized protein LOC135399996 [Ornithodoros turicata]|uniref:uncharacterized protein LOC135399996 n=1 Tax=Ornithodoros turicata TaxID=34597 RepID=UPI00313A4907
MPAKRKTQGKANVTEASPSNDWTEKPITVPELQRYFRKHGVCVTKPCTTPCWIATNLTLWNSILHVAGLELREHLHGRLTLTTFQSCDLNTNPHRDVCAYVVLKLLKGHPCIEAVELQYEGQLLESIRAKSPLTSKFSVDAFSLTGRHINKLEASKLIRAATRGNVSHISIKGIRLTYDDIDFLSVNVARNAGLNTISLCETGLRGCDSMVLVRSLNANVTVTVLDLSWNMVGVRGAQQLSLVLKGNTVLQKLILYRAKIRNKGAMAIASALKINNTLVTLSLGQNDIGPTAAAVFGEALEINESLKYLDLKNNEICGSGAVMLANMLRVNSTLKELHLCENMIGDVGTVALGNALCVNSTLQTLSLSANEFNYSGSSALAQCVEKNSSLTRLNVVSKHPFVINSHLTSFIEALKNNRHLQGLELSVKCEDAMQELPAALMMNTSLRELSIHSDCGSLEALFLALAKNRTLEALELDCSLCLHSVEALCWLFECTKTIRYVTIAWHVTSGCLEQVMCGLEKNTSVMKFRTVLSSMLMGESAVSSITSMLRANKTLSALVIDRGGMSEAGLSEVVDALEQNRSLLSLTMVYPPISKEAFKVKEALRKNWTYLHRAAKFAVLEVTDKCSAEAFEFHRNSEILFSELTASMGLSDAEAEKAIHKAKMYIRNNYFVVCGVVKTSVVCTQPSPNRLQTLLHHVNPYCLLEIVSYLKVSDVLLP